MDASRITCDSSASSGASHTGACISPTAWVVPSRQGVHWPQDSCSKNCMRLSAASRALSCWPSTTTAMEPMKAPYSARVSKSSGTSASAAGRMPPDAPPGR
ncbi:hypothetical protein D9M68_970360 [compost metagenome]